MAARILRVFPRRTALTPTDDTAFVGEPPLIRPEADEVRVSVCFTWDVPTARHLAAAWRQYYPIVRLGGPAAGSEAGIFEPGLYVKPGVVFTSRGCNSACDWCLVPMREGRLRLLPVQPGHIIQDNNILACPPSHRRAVYAMLGKQPKAAEFAGGLQASFVTDEIAAELRDVRISQLFLAADTEGALRPLERAVARLSFLPRRKLRCYMLLAWNGETIPQARARLEAAWQIGVLPFAQLWQPPENRINYGLEWRALAKEWSRPAAMFANHPLGRGY